MQDFQLYTPLVSPFILKICLCPDPAYTICIFYAIPAPQNTVNCGLPLKRSSKRHPVQNTAHPPISKKKGCSHTPIPRQNIERNTIFQPFSSETLANILVNLGIHTRPISERRS